MKKLLIFLSVIAVVVSACQKEASHEESNRNPGGGNTNGTKPVRFVNKIGNDSAIVDNSYNGFDRLVLISYSGVANGEPINIKQAINRDAANVITSSILVSPFFSLAGFGSDSLVTKYEHDLTTGHYVRAVLHYVLDGVAQSDSAVFIYDNAGRVASAISYIGDSTGYEADNKVEYTYAGDNLASEKNFSYAGGGWQLDQIDTFEYDSKPNPQHFASDAPVLGMGTYYSVNNVTKRTTTITDLQQTFVTNVSYTYNSNDLPATATGSDGTNISTVNYYYQ